MWRWGWHSRRDPVYPRHISPIIHVHFAEDDAPGLGLGGGELVEDGADLLARPAPVGVEVDHGVGGAGEGGFEVRGGGDGDDRGGHFRAGVNRWSPWVGCLEMVRRGVDLRFGWRGCYVSPFEPPPRVPCPRESNPISSGHHTLPHRPPPCVS